MMRYSVNLDSRLLGNDYVVRRYSIHDKSGFPLSVIPAKAGNQNTHSVIPAQAGIQYAHTVIPAKAGNQKNSRWP
jgi:hypothetical protein